MIATIGVVAVMVILLLGTLWTGRSARKDTEEAVRAVSLLYYLDELAQGREGVGRRTSRTGSRTCRPPWS